jgi:hypothetical protein
VNKLETGQDLENEMLARYAKQLLRGEIYEVEMQEIQFRGMRIAHPRINDVYQDIQRLSRS